MGERSVGGVNEQLVLYTHTSWPAYSHVNALGLHEFIANSVFVNHKHKTFYAMHFIIQTVLTEVIKTKFSFCSVSVDLESLLYNPIDLCLSGIKYGLLHFLWVLIPYSPGLLKQL